MKIDLEKYLTMAEAVEAIGAPNTRSVYRAIKRAREAGHEDVVAVILGRYLVPKAAVETLKQFYYPYYSEAHQRMVKKWGAAGGHAGAKAKAKARAAKR